MMEHLKANPLLNLHDDTLDEIRANSWNLDMAIACFMARHLRYFIDNMEGYPFNADLDEYKAELEEAYESFWDYYNCEAPPEERLERIGKAFSIVAKWFPFLWR